MKRICAFAIVVACVAAMSLPGVGTAASIKGGGSKVVPLGQAFYKGRLVEGFAFVHGRGGAAKPGGGSGGTSKLYTFLARGAKWRSVEDYEVYPANADEVSTTLVSGAMARGVATWEAPITADVIGSGTTTDQALQADYAAPDGVNEVYFSSTELDQRTVAVTVVWGVFSGPAETREIIEWDMVFNDALPERWGDATAATGVWDVEDIATHELGHACGLGDLYTTSAVQQTMYGYASPGETSKRTLEAGDIAGIKTLYR